MTLLLATCASLMVCLASLLCGAAIYPVVVHLAGENVRKTKQVLESHIAMMEMTIMRTHVDQGEHIVTGAGGLDGARDVVGGPPKTDDG